MVELVPALFYVLLEMFYLSHPGTWTETLSPRRICVSQVRDFLPSRGSRRTAPIACGGVDTAHAVAGREYHCPEYASWQTDNCGLRFELILARQW